MQTHLSVFNIDPSWPLCIQYIIRIEGYWRPVICQFLPGKGIDSFISIQRILVSLTEFVSETYCVF